MQVEQLPFVSSESGAGRGGGNTRNSPLVAAATTPPEHTEIKSGGGTVRHMVYDEKENALWFGTDTNTIGRATLP